MPILNSAEFESEDWMSRFKFGSRRSFDDELIPSFLNELSRAILKCRETRNYPDLITFAYFCRKASISRAQSAIADPDKRIGWGTMLHISPSNIPINFAFSLVMSIVAGNSNVVRLPTRTYPQMEMLVGFLDEILAEPKYSDFADEIIFMQSDRDSQKLTTLVEKVQGLIVWGGDATVSHFRSMKKSPRCIELYFPSRVSSVILASRAVLEADAKSLNVLCRDFFNDTYLVDQNACSSPSLVLWYGNPSDRVAARDRFWSALNEYLCSHYRLDPTARIQRSLDVMSIVNDSNAPLKVSQKHNDIWLISDDGVRGPNLRFGMFLEIDLANLAQLREAIRTNEQTLTVFGVSPERIFGILKEAQVSVDRIVPIGRALDMGFNWDGREILSLLSKKIQVG